MIDRLGITLARARFHRRLQRPFDDTIICRERGQPIRLRLEAGARPDDVEKFRLQALHFPEELRVEAKLKHGLRFRLAGQLAIHGFV